MMIAGNHRSIFYRVLLVLAVAGLIVGMAVFAEASPFGGDCGDDCSNECDDSCTDCGDCVNCAPTSHLSDIQSFDHNPIEDAPASTAAQAVSLNETQLSMDIDHPPQNRS